MLSPGFEEVELAPEPGDIELPSATAAESEIPPGFEDPEYLREVGSLLRRVIDDFQSDQYVSECMEMYQLAENVYNDMETMSSLEFIEDARPYNVPLASIRVDGVVSYTTGAYTTGPKHWVITDGGDDGLRAAVESDLNLAWKNADFENKVKDIGYCAAIKGRGPFKLSFEIIRTNEGWTGNLTNGWNRGLLYAGLRIDTIDMKDFGYYPTYVKSIPDARAVWFRTEERYRSVRRSQLRGDYLNHDPVAPNKGKRDTSPSEIEDYGLDVYEMVVWLPPKHDDDDEFPNEVPVLVKLAYDQSVIISIKSYNRPCPWIFAPTLRNDYANLLPAHSVMSRMLEIQAVYNDTFGISIFGLAASVFLTVLASNFTAEKQHMRLGLGSLWGFRGSPTFTTLQNSFNPSIIPLLVESLQKTADGLARLSQITQGQSVVGDTTATEVKGLISGGSEGIREYRSTFNQEMRRAAYFSLGLLYENFDAFRAFNVGRTRSESAEAFAIPYSVDAATRTGINQHDELIQKMLLIIKLIGEFKIPTVGMAQPIDQQVLFEKIFYAMDVPWDIRSMYASVPPQVDPGSDPGQVSGEDSAAATVDPAVLGEVLNKNGTASAFSEIG